MSPIKQLGQLPFLNFEGSKFATTSCMMKRGKDKRTSIKWQPEQAKQVSDFFNDKKGNSFLNFQNTTHKIISIIPFPPPTRECSCEFKISPKCVSKVFKKEEDEEPFPFKKLDQLVPPTETLAASREKLKQFSHGHPLLPLPATMGNLNPVFITHFPKNSHVRNVVCKLDMNAALHNVICFHLARLTHLDSVVVPTTMGRATVVLPKDPEVIYKILSLSNDQRILIHDEDQSSQIEDLEQEEDGSLTCLMNKMKLRLLPQEDGFYRVEVQPTKMALCLQTCHEFTLVTHDNGADSIEEALSVGLVPCDQVFSELREKNGREYVKIDDLVYLLKSESETITLEGIQKKDHFAQIKRPEIIKQKFIRVYQEDPEGGLFEVLVPKNSYFDCHQTKKNVMRFSSEGNNYIAQMSDQESFTVVPSSNRKIEPACFDFNNELFVLANNFETNQVFLVASSAFNLISQDENGKDVISRYDQQFQLEKSEDEIRLVGRDLFCMVQEKIENAVTRSYKNAKPMNLLRLSSEREEFFQRIETSDFIKCWLAIMLLRTQDCKVSDLTESNVLFTQQGEHLKMFLIDLDETLPPANDRSYDDELTKSGVENIHPVRNGLMAFPQARVVLKNDEKALIINLIKDIISARESIDTFLRFFIKDLGGVMNFQHFNQAHIHACLEVIDKMAAFLDSKTEQDEWTLQDLFFTVFPEYKQQWDELSKAGFSVEDKALSLGNVSVATLLEAEKSRAQRCRSQTI